MKPITFSIRIEKVTSRGLILAIGQGPPLPQAQASWFGFIFPSISDNFSGFVFLT